LSMGLLEKLFPLITTLAVLMISPLVILMEIIYFIKSFLPAKNAIRNPKVIFITGASSGIGKQLAVSYSKPGVNIAITGRNKERLKEVADECTELGASIHIINVDVKDRENLSNEIIKFDDEYPIDIMIANAGISEGTSDKNDIVEDSYNVFETNTLGVFNTMFPIIKKMKSRRKGQIAIIASLASYVPLKGALSYSSSKAAVLSLGRGYRNLLKRNGIGFTIVTPGFVKTGITEKNKFYMPFLMDVETAGKKIVDGLKKDSCIITFPFILSVLVRLLYFLPPEIADLINI